MGKSTRGKEESLPPILSAWNSPWPTHRPVPRLPSGQGRPQIWPKPRPQWGSGGGGSHGAMGRGGERRCQMGGEGRGGVRSQHVGERVSGSGERESRAWGGHRITRDE
jgi:hypothetical protein